MEWRLSQTVMRYLARKTLKKRAGIRRLKTSSRQ